MLANTSQLETIIDQDAAVAQIFRNFLPAEYANELLQYLLKNTEWEQHRHNVGMENRVTYRMGDSGVIHGYTGQDQFVSKYSLTEQPIGCVKPWLEPVRKLRDLLNQLYNTTFNAALLNCYRNGNDYIGMHSDRECLPPRYIVIALSLGQRRDFHFRRKSFNSTNNPLIKTYMDNGDMMLMYGRCQELYKHGVPARKGQKDANMGIRISITFRELTKH